MNLNGPTGADDVFYYIVGKKIKARSLEMWKPNIMSQNFLTSFFSININNVHKFSSYCIDTKIFRTKIYQIIYFRQINFEHFLENFGQI